jgi:hypothetical protein
MFAQAASARERRSRGFAMLRVRESVAAQPDRHAGRFSRLLVRGIAAAEDSILRGKAAADYIRPYNHNKKSQFD